MEWINEMQEITGSTISGMRNSKKRFQVYTTQSEKSYYLHKHWFFKQYNNPQNNQFATIRIAQVGQLL